MAALDDIRNAIAATGRTAVEARFYLSGVKRYQAWRGEDDPTLPIATQVEFTAARHGTFGKATPSGTIQMSIANPDAAALFDRAQLEGLTERRQSPVFRIFLVQEEPDEAE